MKDLKSTLSKNLIKDLKSALSRDLIKNLKKSLIKEPYQGSKKCLIKEPYQGSKKYLIKLVWEYPFLLVASKTCDLPLIKKKRCSIVQNLEAVIQKLVKLARVSF